MQVFDRAMLISDKDLIATKGVSDFLADEEQKKKTAAAGAPDADAVPSKQQVSIDNVAMACGVKQVHILKENVCSDEESDKKYTYDRYTSKLREFTDEMLLRADIFARRSYAQDAKAEAEPHAAAEHAAVAAKGSAEKSDDRTIDLRSVLMAAGTMGGRPSGPLNSRTNDSVLCQLHPVHRVAKATEGDGEAAKQGRVPQSDFLKLAQQQGLISNLAVTELPPIDMTVPPPWASRSVELQSSKTGGSPGLPAAIIGVLRQVHPDTQMGPVMWHQFIQFSIHMCHRIGFAAGIVAAAAAAAAPAEPDAVEGSTPLQVDAVDIEESLGLVYPGELVKHSRSEMCKAVAKYEKDPQNPGLIVSSVDTAFYLAQIAPAKMEFSPKAAVAVAAVVEYTVAEIMELGGNAARDNRKSTIIPTHAMLGVWNDEELCKMFAHHGFVFSLARAPTSLSRGTYPVYGHTVEHPDPAVSIMPLDPAADLTAAMQPCVSLVARSALQAQIALVSATVANCKGGNKTAGFLCDFDPKDFRRIAQESQVDLRAAEAAVARLAAAAEADPAAPRTVPAVVPKEFWVGNCSERAAGAAGGAGADELYEKHDEDSDWEDADDEEPTGTLQYRLKTPEEESEMEVLPAANDIEEGTPDDLTVTKGRYPSTDEADVGPTSRYQAADLDAAPSEGESLWPERRREYAGDDPETAYVAEPEFRKQAASGAARPATVMDARSLWGFAWQIECPGLDETTVLAALTDLGRKWIAGQLGQTPSVSGHTADAPARVTVGQLLGTMDVVPLLPSRVTGIDPSTDAPAYRTGYLSEFQKWLLLRREQKDAAAERAENAGEETEEKVEFVEAPNSVADALKDGCLNATGRFEDETFADIAVQCKFPRYREENLGKERRKTKYEARPAGDDKYRLPPAPNIRTYRNMAGLWIKPCHFQNVVMDVLEQTLGCTGGWIQRSALHALQVSFESVVLRTLVEARLSAYDRKSALVAGADVALAALESGFSQSTANTIDWAGFTTAVEKQPAGAGGAPLQTPLPSSLNALVEMSGCISASKSLVEADAMRDLIVEVARDRLGNVKFSPDALTGLVAMVEGRLTTMMLGEGRRCAARTAADSLQGNGVSLDSVPASDWVAAGVNLDESCGATEEEKAGAIFAAVTKLVEFQTKRDSQDK